MNTLEQKEFVFPHTIPAGINRYQSSGIELRDLYALVYAHGELSTGGGGPLNVSARAQEFADEMMKWHERK